MLDLNFLEKCEAWDLEPFAGCENAEVPYAKWVLENIPCKPQKILDVGCGTGVHTKWFNENGMECYGITINKEEIVKKVDRHVGFGSMCCIPFDDNTFDLVFCLGSLEHTYFPFLAFLEFNRVLQVGGHLFVDMPPLSNFEEFDKQFWYHKMILFPIQIRDMMRKTKFELISKREGGYTEIIIPNPANPEDPQFYQAETGGRYIGRKIKDTPR